MIRWWIFLAIALGVLAVSASTVIGLKKSSDLIVERVRQSRIRHQALEQQLATLHSPRYEQLAQGLGQTLETLQIELAEVMANEARSPDVLDLTYEQTVLAQTMQSTEQQPISTLRLMMSVKIQHAAGLLALLKRIDHHLAVWPHEVRACDMYRMTEDGLQARCVIDFYHWSQADRVGSWLYSNKPDRAKV